jgi:hypothetical protein
MAVENVPLGDIVAEAKRILTAAQERSMPVRLIGGVAVRIHASDGLRPAFVREYEDIDLVTTRKASRALSAFFSELGYAPNDRFNSTNAGLRMVFYDLGHGRQVDVFVEDFEMCHKIAVAKRLDLDPWTIPLAELLLTKLQVVRLNPKDLTDIAALVLEHDVGPGDVETINEDYIATALAGDWGLWRTVQGTIATTRDRVPGLALGADDQRTIDDRLERLWLRVESEPKSLRWKARARVGERATWYQEPDEVEHEDKRSDGPATGSGGKLDIDQVS